MQGCPCENVTHYRELYEMQVSVLNTSGSKSKKFQVLYLGNKEELVKMGFAVQLKLRIIALYRFVLHLCD